MTRRNNDILGNLTWFLGQKSSKKLNRIFLLPKNLEMLDP